MTGALWEQSHCLRIASCCVASHVALIAPPPVLGHPRTPELLLVELLFLPFSRAVETAWTALFAALGDKWVWIPLPFRFTWRLALTLEMARVLGRATAWHTTFAVNSYCHDAAAEAAADGCRSLNLSWLAWLSCGDSYHANHHRRGRAARHAPPGRTDLAFAVMRAAERFGVVTALQA